MWEDGLNLVCDENIFDQRRDQARLAGSFVATNADAYYRKVLLAQYGEQGGRWRHARSHLLHRGDHEGLRQTGSG